MIFDVFLNLLRLFGFLKGFLESPFVLVDSEKELQFRDDLVSLYGRLVPSPTNESRTQANLRKVLENVKKARLQASVSQLCDLNTLLGDETEGFEVCALFYYFLTFLGMPCPFTFTTLTPKK